MSINRHNYEEFFVMYADGELSEALRQEVDAFVARHPDLADELQLMLDLKLDATELPAMPGKASLLKPLIWDAEALTPEQTQLLEWLDGQEPADIALQLAHHPQLLAEWQQLQQTRLPHTPQPMPASWRMLHTTPWPAESLSPDQELMASAVDQPELEGRLQPLLQQAIWQKEWYLLQQTRLQASAETMPGKERLYRHAPVVGMATWRKQLVRALAAAAIMAGAGWFLFSGPQSTPASQPNAPVATAKNQQPATSSPANTPVGPTASASDAIAATATPAAAASRVQPAAASQRQPTATLAATPAEAASTTANNPASTMQTLIAANRLTPEEEKQLEMARLQGTQGATGNKSVETAASQPRIDVAKSTPDVQPTVTYAVYQPTLAQEDEEEKFVRIAGAKINKQKLRGVFRTVSRTVTRNFEKSDLNEDLKQATTSLR